MSQLIALIDEYRDAHGAPPSSSVARAADIAPQTISAWRRKGLRELPDQDILERLAAFIRVDFEVVRDAALVDIGWMTHEEFDQRHHDHQQRRAGA